jgi:hypothetical protein
MTPPKGLMGGRLALERYHAMCGTLRTWRIGEIQELERSRRKGRILGFVRGLRFASQLIYSLRTTLSGENVDVSWGHLLDDTETLCSPECDIIIHKKGFVQQWNGDGGHAPVMDFKFVRSVDALAIISCKSWLTQIDPAYAGDVKKYCPKVYLFAECCPPKRIAKLKAAATAAGYGGFWCLYTFDPKTLYTTDDESQWLDFVKTVQAI